MTVLMVTAVRPSNGARPYIIMGADTKKIGYNIYTKLIDVDDEFDKKLHEINGKLVGFCGRFPDELIDQHLRIVSEHEDDLKSLIDKSFEYLKKVIIDTEYEDSKIRVYIAAIEDNQPVVGIIDIRKEDIKKASQKLETVIEVPLASSNFQNYEDLMGTFHAKIKNNQKFDRVRKYVVSCLKEAASRRPETCNQKIVIKTLGK